MTSTSVDTLVSKFVSEYPAVPKDDFVALLSYDDIRGLLTAVQVDTSKVVELVRSKPEGNAVATWLEALDPNHSVAALEKLKVIATTTKLMDMIPEGMRTQIEGMVNSMNQPPKPAAGAVPQGTITTDKNAAAAPPPPGGGATKAMNMINQMLNSGMLQQMQDMANEDADDLEMLKADVEQLKKENAQMKKLLNSIIAKMNDTKKKKKAATSEGR